MELTKEQEKLLRKLGAWLNAGFKKMAEHLREQIRKEMEGES